MLKVYNGQTIRVREGDNYVSGTDMGKATGKLFGHWSELKSTQEFLQVLSISIGIPIAKLVEIKKGGAPGKQGTWLHPKVAIQFAQWCSPVFGIKVSHWIDELLTNGVVTADTNLDKFDDPKELEAMLKASKAKSKAKCDKRKYNRDYVSVKIKRDSYNKLTHITAKDKAILTATANEIFEIGLQYYKKRVNTNND